MSRSRCARLLSLAVVAALPLGALAPACTSATVSTAGQRITCSDTGSGVTSCHPDEGGSAGSDSDTCEDIDMDGDGSPHDVGEDHHTAGGSAAGGAHDGATDDDDDGDGVPNERDCDSRHGGDDDDDGDDGSGSGSGSDDDGSGGHDGSGHD